MVTFLFFFNVTATTEIYTNLNTLSLHDALPISFLLFGQRRKNPSKQLDKAPGERSEEHTSELQSHSEISYAVFCLKKKKDNCKEIKYRCIIVMFLDQENLRPVIVAMALYIAISTLVPPLVKKPTGVKAVDDLTMMIIAQRSQMMSGTILIGLIVLATNYIVEEILV